MATITVNKSTTGKTISYRIRCCVGRDPVSKKQVFKTTTIKSLGVLTPAKELKDIERQADEWERKMRLEHSNGLSFDKSKLTIGRFIDDMWLPNCAKSGLKPTTIDFYKNITRRIVNALGDIPLEAVRKDQLQSFILSLNTETGKNGKPISDKTKRHIAVTTAQIFSDALDLELINRSPMPKLKNIKTIKKTTKKDVFFLTESQVQDFIRALDTESPYWRTMMILFLKLGLRRGEACGLRWGDIDFDNGIISIKNNVTYTKEKGVSVGSTKTETSDADIIMPPTISNILKQWKVEQSRSYSVLIRKNAFVFGCRDNPYNPINPQNVTRWLRQFEKRHDLPDASPHDLRHTAITLFASSGAPVKLVQAFARHADVSTTMNIYVGIDQTALREAVCDYDNIVSL